MVIYEIEDKVNAYRMLFDLLDEASGSKENTEDDKRFRINTTEQITNGDEQYSMLLSHFVKITKIRNVLKEIFKWSFYIVVIGSMVACYYMFIILEIYVICKN